MRTLLLSILLAMLAMGSTGCIVIDGYHHHGYYYAGRRPPVMRLHGPHGRPYGPPPPAPHYRPGPPRWHR